MNFLEIITSFFNLSTIENKFRLIIRHLQGYGTVVPFTLYGAPNCPTEHFRKSVFHQSAICRAIFYYWAVMEPMCVTQSTHRIGCVTLIRRF